MKKLLTSLFIPFSITYALSQNVEIESDSNSTCNRISLEISQGIGLGLVQDRLSPMFIYRLGIGINNFKIHLVGSENYLQNLFKGCIKIFHSKKFTAVVSTPQILRQLLGLWQSHYTWLVAERI